MHGSPDLLRGKTIDSWETALYCGSLCPTGEGLLRRASVFGPSGGNGAVVDVVGVLGRLGDRRGRSALRQGDGLGKW